MSVLKNLSVVLVRTENPVNIGQSARAMKNFGVRQLILVQCAAHRVPEAYTPGWKARKILDQARRKTSLDQVLKGNILAVGFTARAGKRRGEPKAFSEMIPSIVEALKKQKVALVFGNEKNGLSNEELKKCHWITTIPAMNEYTSLNLSHAVAIILSSIFNQTHQARKLFHKPRRFYTKPEEFDDLMKDFEEVLKRLDYQNSPQNDTFKRVMTGLRHYFKKSGLERRELHLFKAFLAKIKRIIPG